MQVTSEWSCNTLHWKTGEKKFWVDTENNELYHFLPFKHKYE